VTYRPTLPVTPYDVFMVSAEYDGVADFPDNPFNILAVLNAYQGGDMLHVDAAFNTDFATDSVHYKMVTNADGGTVTYIVIPYTDPILPLLHPMLEAGGDPVALAKLSAFLKPIIDSAYKRNRIFQRNKWSDGIVSIPLPAAATPPPVTPVTPVPTVTSSPVEQPSAPQLVPPPTDTVTEQALEPEVKRENRHVWTKLFHTKGDSPNIGKHRKDEAQTATESTTTSNTADTTSSDTTSDTADTTSSDTTSDTADTTSSDTTSNNSGDTTAD